MGIPRHDVGATDAIVDTTIAVNSRCAWQLDIT
jgi:hypothetical protein